MFQIKNLKFFHPSVNKIWLFSTAEQRSRNSIANALFADAILSRYRLISTNVHSLQQVCVIIYYRLHGFSVSLCKRIVTAWQWGVQWEIILFVCVCLRLAAAVYICKWHWICIKDSLRFILFRSYSVIFKSLIESAKEMEDAGAFTHIVRTQVPKHTGTQAHIRA